MTPPSNKGRTIIKMSAILQAHLIKMLCDGPCTIQEIADETGLHYMTVQVYLRELRKAGAAYIAAWDKDSRGRDAVKVYALGPGKDAKRRKLTPAQRQAASRAKRAQRDVLHATAQPSLSASSSTVGL